MTFTGLPTDLSVRKGLRIQRLSFTLNLEEDIQIYVKHISRYFLKDRSLQRYIFNNYSLKCFLLTPGHCNEYHTFSISKIHNDSHLCFICYHYSSQHLLYLQHSRVLGVGGNGLF